jgi:hypothetical protein
MWENTASQFQNKWQFYTRIGATDGKYVTIRKPLNNGSSFFLIANSTVQLFRWLLLMVIINLLKSMEDLVMETSLLTVFWGTIIQ